jgi:hypothetical protein
MVKTLVWPLLQTPECKATAASEIKRNECERSLSSRACRPIIIVGQLPHLAHTRGR